MSIDVTRRTVAQARRAPQWQRLIDSVHAAQAAAGYAGRQWGAAEVEHFQETLIGMPYSTPYAAETYWVARTVFPHSDGTESVTYRIKVVRGDALERVDTIADAVAHTTGYDGADTVSTPEWEAATALDMIRRAAFLAGVTL
jgi:hypothetical protein